MNLEPRLPTSLRERLNNDKEIFIFDQWRNSSQTKEVSAMLAVDAIYDKQKATFTAKLESAELQTVLDEYRRLNPDEPLWGGCNPEEITWDQVFGVLDNTKRHYDNTNFFRRKFRNEGLISRIAQPLLEAIPGENGIGLIKAGLMVLFHAVKARTECCKRIFLFFQSVPGRIIEARHNRELFPHEESLFTAIHEFYREIVYCLPHLVKLLLRQNKHSLKSISRAIDPIPEVEKLMGPVEEAERKLQQRINHLKSTSQREHLRLDQDTNRETKAIRRTQHQMLHELRQESKIADFWKHRYEEEHHRAQELAAFMLTEFYRLVQDSERCRQLPNESLMIANPRLIASSSMSPKVDRDGLLGALICGDAEYEVQIRDLDSVLRKYDTFSTKAMSQSAYVMMTDHFTRWLYRPGSDILLVDGHCAEEAGKISPISVFCATLVENIRSGDQLSMPANNLVLYFFCGQHAWTDGLLSGPCGLIRSLISQLLIYWPERVSLDLRFLEEVAGLWDSIMRWDVPRLCDVFAELLWQLPRDTSLYCIIDGISEFETSLWGWSKELRTIMTCFQTWLSQNNTEYATTASVKVFLAGARKSTLACDYVSPSCKLDLRAGNFHPR